MAGDYVPMDHDLPDKPEVLAIIEATGARLEDVFFWLFKLWRLGDGQTLDGRIKNCGPVALAVRCGGTKAFWTAVATVTATPENPEGWLRFEDGDAVIPRFAERFKRCAKKRRQDGAARVRRWRERQNVTQSVTQNSVTPPLRTELQGCYQVVLEPEPEPDSSCTNVQERNSPPSFPPELSTDDFRSAWADWLRHRKETHKPLKPTAIENKLAQLAKMGPARAVAAIRYSIGNGWQGIFEERNDGNGRLPQNNVGSATRPRSGKPLPDRHYKPPAAGVAPAKAPVPPTGRAVD